MTTQYIISMKKVEHQPSKRYQGAVALIDPKKSYPIAAAVALAKQTSMVKFDASMEIHIRLNLNTKKSDQQVRSSVALPHGTGKTLRVAVITIDGDQQKAAKAAGADLVGDQDLIAEIKDGKAKFDILVATPDSMKLLSPLAKILGPKGLMPNPKDGTVTQNAAEAVSQLKKGKVNYKNDDSGNIHGIIGKISFADNQLVENYQAFIDSVNKVKPAGVKGTYIRNISLSTSMGPGIKVSF